MRIYNNNLADKMLTEPCMLEIKSISDPISLDTGLVWLSVLFEEIDSHSNYKMNLTFQPIDTEFYAGGNSKAFHLLAPLLDLEHVEGISVSLEELKNILSNEIISMSLRPFRNTLYPKVLKV